MKTKASKKEQLKHAQRITFKKITSTQLGSPRYVCHFLHLLTQDELNGIGIAITERYAVAVRRAHKIGGKKYHTGDYGGGIVFTSIYNTGDLASNIEKLVDDATWESHCDKLVKKYAVKQSEAKLVEGIHGRGATVAECLLNLGYVWLPKYKMWLYKNVACEKREVPILEKLIDEVNKEYEKEFSITLKQAIN